MGTECQELLTQLKSMVENISSQCSSNNIPHGALGELYVVVENMFKHECKVFDSQGEPDVWGFVQALAWLQPCLSLGEHSKCIQPGPTAMPWLYKCLQDRCLSDRLSWLLSDSAHVSQYYQSGAFLSHPKFSEAAILCLMAYEQNLLPLLTIINPKLYTSPGSCLKQFTPTHRKSVSFSETIIQRQQIPPCTNSNSSKVISPSESAERKFRPGIKSWCSVPELCSPVMFKKPLSDPMKNKSSKCSRKKPSVSPSLLCVDYAKDYTTRPEERCTEPVPEAMDALGYFFKDTEDSGECHNYYNINITSCAGDGKRKSFLQDGGNSILPMALGNFPKPVKGESLLSFLSTSQYSRSNAELDRENSHFYIAEAVICAVEQVKWEMELSRLREADDRLSSPVIGQEAKEEGQHSLSPAESMATIHSALDNPSEVSSSPYYSARCSLSLEEEEVSRDTLLHTACSESMLTLSLDSLNRSTSFNSSWEASSSSSTNLSAESLAISLLRKFSDQQLPAASDIHWLMSEEDPSPHEASPLSSSYSLTAESSDNNNSTLLRGTYEWAPPRPQVIFFPHPTPVRHVIMMKQNLRCAGCGMRVALQYSGRFRYCSYLGRYFCTGCHANQTALIPGKIIQSWNFKKYPVSKFSFELLDSVMLDPLFRLADLNSTLYRKVQALAQVRKLRLQLHSFKDFLLTCRFAESMRAILLGQEPHILMDPEVYSLQDLVDVKAGTLCLKLKDLVVACSAHVLNCELCQGRGFMCELCDSEETIFPWQLANVQRCTNCGTCYHTRCLSRSHCKRCQRLNKRRESAEPG